MGVEGSRRSGATQLCIHQLKTQPLDLSTLDLDAMPHPFASALSGLVLFAYQGRCCEIAVSTLDEVSTAFPSEMLVQPALVKWDPADTLPFQLAW